MKLKLLTAALVLAASGSAHASIANSQLTSPAPELYFTAWYIGDPDTIADDTSYSRDLGSAFTTIAGVPVVSGVGTINDWASASNPTSTTGKLPLVTDKVTAGYKALFAPDQTLLNWLAGFTPEQKATIRWNVTSADSNGVDRVLTTAKEVPTGDARATYQSFRTWSGVWDTHLAAVNAMPGQEQGNVAFDGSSTATAADGAAYSGGVAWGPRFGGQANFDTSGLMGESLNFYAFWEHTATGNVLTKVNFDQFLCAVGPCVPGDLAGKWTFAMDGNLTYAVPIPEADTYALLLAGLGVVGLVARRRRA